MTFRWSALFVATAVALYMLLTACMTPPVPGPGPEIGTAIVVVRGDG